MKKILEIAYTAADYIGFAKCYERVLYFWYIRSLTRYFRDYLKYCFECLVYQIRRYSLYDSMQLIYNPSISFYILIFDFILAMPLISDGIDYAISVICKFSKRNTFVLDKIIWKAMQ